MSFIRSASLVQWVEQARMTAREQHDFSDRKGITYQKNMNVYLYKMTLLQRIRSHLKSSHLGAFSPSHPPHPPTSPDDAPCCNSRTTHLYPPNLGLIPTQHPQ